MGITCSHCYSENQETSEINYWGSTLRIEKQCEISNIELEKIEYLTKKDPRTASMTQTSLEVEETLMKKTKTDLNKRVLSEKEYKTIDLKFFLSQDDLSTLDLTICIEGVAKSANEIFELNSGSIYKGEFDIDGIPHGRGIEVKPNGSKYLGYYFHGKIQGPGRLCNKEGVIYQGPFVTLDSNTRCEENSVLNGLGKEIWPFGIKYEGEFCMGIKKGKGKLSSKECTYIGDFYDDKFHGEGERVWVTGKKYKGEWNNGVKHGVGEFSWPNGKKYIGEYENDEKNGKGKMIWPNGKQYDGFWKDGKQHGEGVYTFYDKKQERLRAGRSEWFEGSKLRWLSPVAEE